MNGKITCAISGKEYASDKAVPLSALDQNLQRYIFATYASATKDSHIGEDQLISIKKDYLNGMLASELGELDALEQEVVKSISENKILSEHVDEAYEETFTFGERVADRIAEFGGSWKFIIFFFSFIVGWISLNVFWLSNDSYDPYPFILLNLILSCLAAIQAPIIMMSQNRQESKDRRRSEQDYKVNLKAELEIQLLHKKIDHVLVHQSKRLLEIERVQVEIMEAVLKRLPNP
jgi:uncharacterized membrane protein